MLYSPFYRWDTWVLEKLRDWSQSTEPAVAEVGFEPKCDFSTCTLYCHAVPPHRGHSSTRIMHFKCKHPVPLLLLQRVFFQLLSYVMFWGTSIQETVYTLWTLNEGKWPFSVVRKIAQVKHISRFLWRNTFTFFLRNQRKMMKIRRI